MSFENTICPCKGTKKPNTMLCDDCERDFKATVEFAVWQDKRRPVEQRRHAAIILVSRAKKRPQLMRRWAATNAEVSDPTKEGSLH